MVDSLKIGPDIFVGLKEGGVGKYYKVGRTLGEGKLLDLGCMTTSLTFLFDFSHFILLKL